MVPLFRSVLNQVKTCSKVCFQPFVIRLNEQYLGSVLSVKTGLLTWHTKTEHYEIQALNSEHVISCAKIIQLLKHGESALKSHRRGSKHKELAAFKIVQLSAVHWTLHTV